MGIVVALGGPPHSGKSCLREGLKNALRGITGAPYAYVVTAAPDGEGAWFQGAVTADPVLARELKHAYKGIFTQEFVDQAAGWVARSWCPGRARPQDGRLRRLHRPRPRLLHR